MPDSSQARSASPSAGQTHTLSVAEYPLTGVDGRDLRLRIWVTRAGEECPTAPASGARRQLPTMLLLDGQWLSETIGQTLLQLADTPMLVASLGFSTGERTFTAPWRARDYTPASPHALQCDPRNEAWPCGGADTLLHLLEHEVLPLLQRQHHANPAHTALFGHSYAGLFSTYTWLRAPALFSHIYAASPSLWWYWPHAINLIDAIQPGSAKRAETEASPAGTALPAPTSNAPEQAGAAPARRLSDTTRMSNSRAPHTHTNANTWPPLHLLVGADERWRPLPAEPGMPRPEGISTIPFAEQFLQALQVRHPQADTRLDILPDLAHGPMLHASAARCLLAFGAQHTRR
ncbi:MAG: alpha/beta hydrolase-fold protein [Lautropia sp.]|nr:alpha/beta hydrolase-fold protein [Lautropia sp.]